MSALPCLPLGARAKGVNIDNAELARLAAEGVAEIDRRTARDGKQTGGIPGSQRRPFFDAPGRADPPVCLGQSKAATQPDQPVILLSGLTTARA